VRVSALAALALLAGCSSGAETLSFAPIAACFKVEQPMEKVFRSADEWQDFHRGAALRPADPVPAVDFAQKMVVARFDGGGSACVGFAIESVEVDGDGVTVQAARHTSPNPCILILAYPQVVLEVPRRDLPVRFRIRDVQSDPPAETRPCF
jgi:hypothetical protein